MDLNLRNVDQELLRELKVQAASNGMTLKDFCVWVLRKVVQDAVGSGSRVGIEKSVGVEPATVSRRLGRGVLKKTLAAGGVSSNVVVDAMAPEGSVLVVEAPHAVNCSCYRCKGSPKK